VTLSIYILSILLPRIVHFRNKKTFIAFCGSVLRKGNEILSFASLPFQDIAEVEVLRQLHGEVIVRTGRTRILFQEEAFSARCTRRVTRGWRTGGLQVRPPNLFDIVVIVHKTGPPQNLTPSPTKHSASLVRPKDIT